MFCFWVVFISQHNVSIYMLILTNCQTTYFNNLAEGTSGATSYSQIIELFSKIQRILIQYIWIYMDTRVTIILYIVQHIKVILYKFVTYCLHLPSCSFQSDCLFPYTFHLFVSTIFQVEINPFSIMSDLCNLLRWIIFYWHRKG